MEPLSTDRLVLREFVSDDERALSAIFADRTLFEYNNDQPPPESARELIERLQDAAVERLVLQIPQFEYWFAIADKDDGPLLGWVNLDLAPGNRPEIGVVLARDNHRQGFASEAVKEVLGFAFHLPDVDHVDAECHVANTPSIGLFESLGGIPVNESEGDSRWYRLTRD